MSAFPERPRFDAAGYLAWEAGQSERHEFVDGEVYAMTGARDAHNRVAGNIYIALRDALRGTPCRTFMADMKLHLAHAGSYVYPDVFVTCDERDRAPEADVAKQHPLLVVEVLSESTAACDRGRKFELLRGLLSLREVLFVEPDRPSIDRFARGGDGSWVLHPAGAADTLVLDSIGVKLPVAAVYEDVLPAGSNGA